MDKKMPDKVIKIAAAALLCIGSAVLLPQQPYAAKAASGVLQMQDGALSEDYAVYRSQNVPQAGAVRGIAVTEAYTDTATGQSGTSKDAGAGSAGTWKDIGAGSAGTWKDIGAALPSTSEDAGAGSAGMSEDAVPGLPDASAAASDSVLHIRAQDSILPAPESAIAAKITYQCVVLNWGAVEGAAGYQVEYSSNGTDYTIAGHTAADTLVYKCKKLLTGTSYQFRICALDEAGKAGNYASVTAKPFLKKTKFTATSISGLHAVKLEWRKVPGAESYHLYRRPGEQGDYKLVATTGEPSYTDGDITFGETYFYRVQAVRDVGGKMIKAKLSAQTQAAAALSTTQLETCEAQDSHSIRLTWQQAAAATGYYLYRSTKENGTYKKIKTINDNTVLTYTDTGAVPGKTFYYKICTYMKEDGQAAVPGELSACMSAKPQAEAPKLSGVKTDVSGRSLVLSWSRRTDVDGYRVFRSVYPDKKFAQVAEVVNGVATSYEDRGVVPGSTYYYRIKTLYTNGKYKGVSPASNVVQGDAAPSAPIGLQVRQTATDTLEIRWEKSPGARSYKLYRAEAGAGVYTCIAPELAGNSYTDTQRKDNRTYFYQVSAVGAAGEGTRCMPVSCLVGGVSLDTRTLKVCVGVSKQLTLSTYRQGKVIWKSTDPGIASVDAEGFVTGVAYGTVEVTATVAGKSASATVSVTPGVKNGIDVSRWQEDVDWSRVKKSGVEFAFLRISNHYLEDYTFETKYLNASSVGMPLGVYCYSRATTVEEAQEEARVVLQILGGRKLDYPIALDMEDAVHKAASMTKDTLHQMILAFKQVVEDAGYRFVLYSYVTFLNSNLDKTRLDGIDLWVARYRSVSLGTGYTGTGNQKYWQYNSGQYSGSDYHVDGITDAQGNLVPVDVNVEYGASDKG